MKLLDEGYPLRRLSRESGIRRNQLHDLRKRYLAFGEEGLKRKKRHYATEAEKASVRIEMLEKTLPLNEICIKHNISESAVYSWRKTEGKEQQPMARKRKSHLQSLRSSGPGMSIWKLRTRC